MKTVKDGNWNDPTTWSLNVVPIIGDVLFIFHKVDVFEPIIYCNEIHMRKGGLVTIHQDTTIKGNQDLPHGGVWDGCLSEGNLQYYLQ